MTLAMNFLLDNPEIRVSILKWPVEFQGECSYRSDIMRAGKTVQVYKIGHRREEYR